MSLELLWVRGGEIALKRTSTAAFERAHAPSRVEGVDLVVCPCPLDTGGDQETWIIEHLDEIVVRLGARPSTFGCVGHSAGAGFATPLGVVEGAAAVAVLGPPGVPRVLRDLQGVLAARRKERGAPLEIGWFICADDTSVAVAGRGGASVRVRACSDLTLLVVRRSVG